MKKNEVKIGAILSYILIFFNAIYGLIISPYMLSTIGESEFGVYKTIGSLATSIAVLEFGIGGTLQRYIAKFNAENDSHSSSNFSAMAIIEAVGLSIIMLIVGAVLFMTIDPIYGKSFTNLELARGKQIYIVLLIFVILHFFENVFNGIIAGYNRFIFVNSMKIVSIFLKIILNIVLLPIWRNSLAIVLISVIIEIITISIEILFLKIVLHHRIRLYKWENVLFKESFIYTILLFVQSLIIQFNGNIDNMVIGAVIGTAAVTVYSFAIQIFNMYEQCATSVSGVILPTIVQMEANGAQGSDYEKVVVKYGRIQWMILGAALLGFISCGKEFFSVWLGNGFEDCSLLSLILMIPTTFPLIVNVCLAVLKAKNLLQFRTFVLVFSTILNGILTIVGTGIWGYWAAAAGTAISKVIGSILLMNYYYQKKLGINIFKVYAQIFHRITFCMLVAALVCLGLNKIIWGSWISLALKVVGFCIVYGLLMILFGLNKEEKKAFFRRKS